MLLCRISCPTEAQYQDIFPACCGKFQQSIHSARHVPSTDLDQLKLQIADLCAEIAGLKGEGRKSEEAILAKESSLK